MNKTQHYALPQWEKDDRIMMEDFNAMTGTIDTALNGAAKLVTGTYVGTGECTKNTVMSLDFADTLGRAPALLIVTKVITTGLPTFHQMVLHRGMVRFQTSCDASTSAYCTATWTDTGISWTGPQDENDIMNAEGFTYAYVAIG